MAQAGSRCTEDGRRVSGEQPCIHTETEHGSGGLVYKQLLQNLSDGIAALQTACLACFGLSENSGIPKAQARRPAPLGSLFTNSLTARFSCRAEAYLQPARQMSDLVVYNISHLRKLFNNN